MCWSFEVSIGFALAEAICIAFIIYRAKTSKEAYVQAQIMLVPGLAGIMCVELCEAVIWLDDHIIRIDAEINEENSRPCSTWNSRMTLLLWLIIIPAQPLLSISPLRRIGDPRNMDVLAIPEAMSLFYIFMNAAMYFLREGPKNELPRERVQMHGYEYYGNVETCSYIGQHGHLFWTLDSLQDWITPNGSIYVIVGIVIVYHRPWQFLTVFGYPSILFNFALAEYYDYSVEQASVWCWTGISLHTWVIVQPYLFPCDRLYDYQFYKNKCKTSSNEKETSLSNSETNGNIDE